MNRCGSGEELDLSARKLEELEGSMAFGSRIGSLEGEANSEKRQAVWQVDGLDFSWNQGDVGDASSGDESRNAVHNGAASASKRCQQVLTRGQFTRNSRLALESAECPGERDLVSPEAIFSI